MRFQFGRHRRVDDGVAIGREIAGLLSVDKAQEEAAGPPAHVEKVLGVLEDDDLIGMRAGDLLDAPGGLRAFRLEPFLEDGAGKRGKVGARRAEVVTHPVAISEIIVD